MTAPVIESPLEPMLARPAASLPEGGGWLYEPKWDGFRAIVFRDGGELLLQSRDLKPLNRYFPELEAPLREHLPERCVLDGEIVIAGPRGLDFDALLLRIHPAASRVKLLAAQTPASFVAFDLLALGNDDLRASPQADRRRALEAALARARPPVYLTPATLDRAVAADWFSRFEGAGLDGVVAKRLDSAYQPGKRVMVKVKHARTADCVVAGFRWHKNGPGTLVGSLLLGLYDTEGTLHHVGVTSSFTAARRKELVAELEPLRGDALSQHPWAGWAEAGAASGAEAGGSGGRAARETGAAEAGGPGEAGEGGDGAEGAASASGGGQRMPGATSRWNRGKDLSWEPLRIERVCEVAYDHLQGDRFRHATTFQRWRPDKPVRECRYDQLEETAPVELAQIFKPA
jgi:ATP-dependent DNA ligase